MHGRISVARPFPPPQPSGVVEPENKTEIKKMNLKFAHHGLQFFFITLCEEARRKILSRIVGEESRLVLTPPGDCVTALWRHLHTLNPALTASNSAIMPDHVHLLLIVNYDRDPTFRPLVFIHWFMEETERMMAATDGAAPPHPCQAPSATITILSQERAGR